MFKLKGAYNRVNSVDGPKKAFCQEPQPKQDKNSHGMTE